MDGANLTRRVLQLLNESSTSAFIDERTTFDFLYDGAKDFVIKTECLKGEQTITTTAGTADYVLNGDYLGIFFKYNGKFHVKYYDGANTTFIEYRDWNKLYYENNTTAQSIPDYFTLRDYQTLSARVTATANANGAATGNRSTLTTAASTFANVTVGDIANNVTDGSSGPVVKWTSNTSIDVCLFGGTGNDITTGDSVIIQPKGRMCLTFYPPPSTSSHSCYVPYLKAPDPVYCDYDVYRIPFDYTEALANYAAWKYKYKDKQPDYGDSFYKVYLIEVDKYLRQNSIATAAPAVRFIPRIK
jgi:hypothetical protein